MESPDRIKYLFELSSASLRGSGQLLSRLVFFEQKSTEVFINHSIFTDGGEVVSVSDAVLSAQAGHRFSLLSTHDLNASIASA